ncbi:apical asparagine-rich protein AARP [Plasmodium brasilianum]|uniref:Asparagine-rich protein n=2 Tax=Plasmodium (Plasmodium) TaxID=418103 RepID=A0A1A8WPV0_PLAMA|nr:asparagine-rich protein [Plasmodium malariae]KAI4840177.1 apical asparagine-rich protein AARP [Plasmodium brasilianum]SBS94918.1 hypothetical protein PMALA_045420 [Plasmodium malariae]SBT87538.1 asparagine-rich protein [Plasmodium malariae]
MCTKKTISLFLLFMCYYVDGKSVLRKKNRVFGNTQLTDKLDNKTAFLNLKNVKTHNENKERAVLHNNSEHLNKNSLEAKKNESFIFLKAKSKENENDDDEDSDDEEDENGGNQSDNNSENNSSNDEESDNNSIDDHNHNDNKGNNMQPNNYNHPMNNKNNNPNNSAYTALPPPPPVAYHPSSLPKTASGIVGHVVSKVFTTGLQLMGVP